MEQLRVEVQQLRVQLGAAQSVVNTSESLLTAEKAAQAEATLRKWRGMVAGVHPSVPSEAVVAALADDLNTAGAIAELHGLASRGDAAGLLGISLSTAEKEWAYARSWLRLEIEGTAASDERS